MPNLAGRQVEQYKFDKHLDRSLHCQWSQASEKKKGFKLHIAFRWYAADDWPSDLGAVCTIVYRLKAHGFLVTSSQAYGQMINILCNEEDRICRAWRFGETVWHLKEDRDCFDCS
jgi:hypothetical protein